MSGLITPARRPVRPRLPGCLCSVSVTEQVKVRAERLLTGGEAVAAGVALQLLLAVLAVEVIFAG